MVLVRRADREANVLQRQGQLGIWVPLLGQEAAQIGAGRALKPQDMAFPSYREHGVAWCRGVRPEELLGIFRGTDNGSWDPIGKRFHLYVIVIGNPVLIEAYTYRMDAHTTTDDPTRYRLSDELEAWKLKDPIERLRVNLIRHEHADHDFFDSVQADADQLAAELREFCVNMPDPPPE